MICHQHLTHCSTLTTRPAPPLNVAAHQSLHSHAASWGGTRELVVCALQSPQGGQLPAPAVRQGPAHAGVARVQQGQRLQALILAPLRRVGTYVAQRQISAQRAAAQGV